MKAVPGALDLSVRLLDDPCLWCWEIVDRNRGGAIVQSSWASEWMAYETREEALRAGSGRLAERRCVGRRNAGDRRKEESAA